MKNNRNDKEREDGDQTEKLGNKRVDRRRW